MKKIIAILFSLTMLCSVSAVAYAENESDETESVVAVSEQDTDDVSKEEDGDTEAVGDTTTIGAESGSDTETVGDVSDVVSEAVSEAASEIESVASEAESEDETASIPVGTDNPKPEGITVNYAAQAEELPNIGWIVWTVTGVLLAALLVLAGYKFIKYKNSK